MSSFAPLVFNTIAQLAGSATSFLFLIVSARLMSSAAYGDLRYVLTLLPIAMAFSLPGFDTLILRRSAERKQIDLRSIWFIRIFLASVVSAILLGFIFWQKEEISPSLLYYAVATALILPLFETATGYRNYLAGRGIRQQAATMQFASRLTTSLAFSACVTLIILAELDPLWLYPAWLTCTAIPPLYFNNKIASRSPGTLSSRLFKKQTVHSLLGAASLTISGLIATLAFSVDKILAHHILGAATLAKYAVLIMFPQELARLVDSHFSLYYRSIFHKESRVKGKGAVVIAILISTSVVYGVLFWHLSSIVFGDDYSYSFRGSALSALFFLSCTYEFFSVQRVLATSGSKAVLLLSVSNLLCTVPIVWLAVGSGMDALLLSLIMKQLILPTSFVTLYARLKLHA